MEDKKLTPMQAIKAKCLDCCCGDRKEVKLCPCEDCSLWAYRGGKRGDKKNLTEEQRQAMADRFRKAREARSNYGK